VIAMKKKENILGERLKKLRIERGQAAGYPKGFTNRQICYKIYGDLPAKNDPYSKRHAKEALYAQYEKGTSKPNYEDLVKFAKYYNVSTDYLLGASDFENEKDISVRELTGLSAESIAVFKAFNSLNKMDTFNYLTHEGLMPLFLQELFKFTATAREYEERKAEGEYPADVLVMMLQLSEYHLSKLVSKMAEYIVNKFVPVSDWTYAKIGEDRMTEQELKEMKRALLSVTEGK